MFLARVVGSVWATVKHPGLNGYRLLLVQPMDGNPLKPNGKITMAVCDKIDAGVGDLVLVVDEGGSARSMLQRETAPIRTIIVGIVDAVLTQNQLVDIT